MRHDVDGLIVDIKEAANTLTGGHERPVTSMYVRIELEMSRHVGPSSKEKIFWRVSFFPLAVCGVHPSVIDVSLSGPFRFDDSTNIKLLLRRDVGLRGIAQ
ncbi:hypothetical protein M0802_015057 [Mischocyttarus mexicanus]|nr:hypothetical protein M0802_015057 [Mischocyttarus mexicanus]